MVREEELEPAASGEDLLPSESICSRCGMSREEWSGNKGRGVMMAGEIYCCQGCADDAGCTCDSDRVEEEPDEAPTAKKPSRRGL